MRRARRCKDGYFNKNRRAVCQHAALCLLATARKAPFVGRLCRAGRAMFSVPHRCGVPWRDLPTDTVRCSSARVCACGPTLALRLRYAQPGFWSDETDYEAHFYACERCLGGRLNANGSRTESVVDCDTVPSPPCIRPPCPVFPDLCTPSVAKASLFSPPEDLSAALLLFRLTKGGYAWSVARGIIHSSETAWNATTNSVRVCSKPPRPRAPASLQRGRDVCAWLPLHAHTRAYTRIHAHSIERARRSSLCAACVPVCRLQRFQQRERCSCVRRLLWRVALLAAGQPDLVRPTFDHGRVRLICALAAFMR